MPTIADMLNGYTPAPQQQTLASLLRNYPRIAHGGSGLVEPGNIDIYNRPKVRNKDGSVSTVFSHGYNLNGAETLIPWVSPDGRMMNEREAIAHYLKTGQHLGKFTTPQALNEYANNLHLQQEWYYNR